MVMINYTSKFSFLFTFVRRLIIESHLESCTEFRLGTVKSSLAKLIQ
jgi:hypothetical protein